MKGLIKRLVVACMLVAATTMTATAKDYQVALACDPDGAAVYLNGELVSPTTPAFITLKKKMADKTLMFQFVKKGYESKTVVVVFSKKQLENNAVVYGELRKKPEATPKPKAQPAPAPAPKPSETTLTANQERQRVDRNNAGKTDIEKTIIRWYFDSDPRGARVFWRVISSVPAEVKNTNETYMTTTPIEETRSFNINDLTYANSRDVTIEIKVCKKGYEDQVKRFNVRQALDQQEISGFFELVSKENYNSRDDDDDE